MDVIEVVSDPPPPAYLTIPFDIESILPTESLSVVELLRYPFPNPFRTRDGAGAPLWSDSPPHNIDAACLLSCAVPRQKTVKRLLLDAQRLVSTPRSFSRASVSSSELLPYRLPIWVLSFWDRLSEAYVTNLSWQRCLDWLNAPCARHPANQRLVAEVDSLFHRVHWHGYLGGKRQDRHVNDIFGLLSNNELDSGQISDLLELIERRLADTLDNHYLIASTDLSTLVIHSHQNHEGHTYRKEPGQKLVEEKLVQRHRVAVASIAWVPVGICGHWIPYVVDPITSTIYHGDSLGLHIPVDLRDSLVWWLCDLQRRMGEPPEPPSFKPIIVTGQEDGFSCGILAANSLLHHLLPHKFPLVSNDAVSIKECRIEQTIEILKLNVEPVCGFPNGCKCSDREIVPAPRRSGV